MPVTNGTQFRNIRLCIIWYEDVLEYMRGLG
jgi:hypothetical protein